MRLRERVQILRETIYGSTFIGAGFHSYPGPEPGKVHSLGVTYRSPDGKEDKKPKIRSKHWRSGREREADQ